MDWLQSITVGTGVNMEESRPITEGHELWGRYQMFWEVLKTLTESQLIKYLQFVTGSSRITKAVTTHAINFDATPSMIPLGHTCYNTVDIGVYASTEDLRKKLIFAIEHHGGFMEEGFSNGKRIHEDYDMEAHGTPAIPALRQTISSYLRGPDTGAQGD
jgi:hypothetical protein